MEFWRYYRIIRRRRWLIVLGMVICVGFVAYKNETTEPLYTGRTTLMESKGMSKEGVPLFQQQFAQLDVQLRLSNLGQIATSQKVMSSAAQTLADLGLSYSPQEILSHTSVQPVRDTNILAVEVTLPDPHQAVAAADVIAAEFKRVYGELNNQAIRQSREFIEAQVETTRLAMRNAQEKLKDFKEENGVVLLDQQSMSIIQRLSSIKQELNTLQSVIESSHASVQKLEEELSKLDEWELVSETTARNPVWQQLTQQLSVLEAERAAMKARGRGDSHPDVMDLNGKIADVTQQLRTAEEEYVANTTDSKNPTHGNILSSWIEAKVQSAANEARYYALQDTIGDIESELAAVPAKEAKLAQLMADVEAASNTYRLMRNKLDEAKISEQQSSKEASLQTIDPAYVYPKDQKKTLKLLAALILSPILGVGLAFLLHYTDNTIKTGPEAERILEVPVLTEIPASRAHSLVRQRCPEIVSVAHQMLTSNLWIASQNADVNSFAVVSAEPDVGRSVVASNIAVSLAREGARVVLVDADLRQPIQHMIFGLENKAGLSNVLSGAATLEDVFAVTKTPGLLVIPTGPVPDNAVKLLRSQEMKDFVDQLGGVADFVVYDTPAGAAFPDAVMVASHVGHALVVHSAGRVPRGSEAELKLRLESVGVNVLGAALNKVKREDSTGYFHYRRSYQGVSIPSLPGGKKIANV